MNAYLSAVNQKLCFSHLLLGQLQPDHNGTAQLEEALCESVLYQLFCAYHHYLREVATTYQFKSPESILTVSDLVSGLASINKHPGEAQEMSNLEGNPDSWLCKMLSAYEQLSQPPQQKAKTAEFSPIAVMQVDQQDDAVTLGEKPLRHWYECFEEMVDRHRSLMIEC
ncbi:MAG: hypothetical protein KBT53_06570 [Porticoccus sp.]|nr:hypothetical protein [Porticoccus sp.]MBQ0807030.1 hypothetical protein [Porticoccus sp.]